MTFIGIDIGGTNTRAALVDGGKIRYLAKESTTDGVRTAEDFLAKLIRMIESIPNHGGCSAIGIGVPGMVSGNRITTCRNLEILSGFPLVEKIEKHFNKTVYLQNDAKLAALGEAAAGAGRNSDSVAYVGLGTGLGGGTVINKQLYLGASNLGGYFSRIILDGSEIAENLVGGVGLGKQLKAALGREMSVRDFFKAASVSAKRTEKSKEDEVILEILRRFQTNLANLLLNISVTLNPEKIVLGGGITDSAEYFLDTVLKDFRTRAHDSAGKTQILCASLEYPGVIGAALYADSLHIRK